MKTYYSATEEYAIKNIENDGLFPIKSTLECSCGQTIGYFAYDDNFHIVFRVIVCESCYNHSDSIFKL